MTSPTSRGRRRPYVSDSGPAINWPSANPIRQVVSVSCTADGPARRPAEMAGNAGRYMSMDSGANADSEPRMTTSRTRPAAGLGTSETRLCAAQDDAVVAAVQRGQVLRAVDLAEHPGRDVPGGEHGQRAVGVLGRDHRDHADAHVEGLFHVAPLDPAALSDE